MINKKSKKLIFSAIFIIMILTISSIIFSHYENVSWLSLFKFNSYKIRLGNETIRLKKKDNTIALSENDLKAMLQHQYNTTEVYIQFNDTDYKPDEEGTIFLPIDKDNENVIYNLGQLFAFDDKGWITNYIDLSIDDNKFLYVVEDKSYSNVLEDITADIHARLINKDNTIPDDFNMENIVPIKGIKAIISSRDMKLDKETLDNINLLLSKAEDDGVTGFVINSTYRSYQEQKNLFEYRLNEKKNSGVENAFEETAKFVAYPGTSEHQTGMALDILSLKYPKGSEFPNSEEYAWLMENCWDFGFIPRYPEEKVEITKISFEPWHFRYIGKPLSLYAKETGYCLEEVVESLRNNKFTYLETSNNEEYIFLLIKKRQDFIAENRLNMDCSLLELTENEDLVILKLSF